jgi:hypothetical protein
MNLARIALASLGGTLAYFAYGFLLFAVMPAMKTEFGKYPHIYRTEQSMMKVMPFGAIAILVSIVVAAILYAGMHPAGGGLTAGLYFGALLGVFVVCTFAIHNFVNLNIGLTLTIYQCAAYFGQWLIVGVVIGLIYKPS